MKTRLYSLLTVLCFLPGPLLAQQATIIGIYEECTPVSSMVMIDADQMTRADDIAARATAAADGLGFDRAVPVMIESLKRNGITDVRVRRQGQCTDGAPYQFIEAIIDYCGEKLAQAQIHIDGDIFFNKRGTGLELEDFMSEAQEKLSAIGIFEIPRVSLNNLPDCQQETSS